MSRSAATALTIETAIIMRRLQSGLYLAAPVADTSLVSQGSESGALTTQRAFLSEYLITVRPQVLARFCTPEDIELHHVEVPLERLELPERVRLSMPVVFACVLIPERRDAWVLVPAIDHTFFIDRREERDQAIRREIARVVAANEFSGARYLRLFPAEETWLERIEIDIEHGGQGIAGRAGSVRKKLLQDLLRKQARETLRAVAVPMREQFQRPPPQLIARDRELAQLSTLLAGSERRSVLLLGPESSGKSALLQAWIAETQERSKDASGKRDKDASASDRSWWRPVYATSAAQLIAGMSGFGQWQERVEKVMQAAESLDAVLYFDNLGELFGERTERGGAGVAGLMRKYVVEGRVRVVGELTAAGLERAESHHVAFLGAFNRIRVSPLSAEESVDALRQRITWWAKQEPDAPQVSPELCTPIIDLADRYMPYRAFPGKVIRFVEELRVTANPARDVNGDPVVIDLTRAHDSFSLATGIPAFLLREDRALEVERVVATFRERMVGQHEAVRRVVETLCVVKARLQPAGKPLCTFLFVGPTGVGKTELARTLARFLFGSTERMIRFDMSEYTDPLAAERLIRGTESDDGLLTSKVRETPFCVLLLDEIEKAHPSVFDLLLQVCGEGRLTDARGKTAYFHNAIIIMTSNLGAAHKRGALGIGARERSPRDRYMAAVHETFRPEFINRLDRVIAFSQLSPEEVQAVARIAVARICERRGIAGAGVALDVSDDALEVLARGGFSRDYGVRALRRHLDDTLVAPVARLLARVGPEAKGALVHVRTADEPALAGASGKGRLGGEEADTLRFELYRRAAASGRRALRGVAALSALRRQVDEYMNLERVVAVREHLGLLSSQLATMSQEQRQRSARRHDQETGAMEIGFHRLSQLWQAADRMRQDLQAAEEFGLSALFEGQRADEWLTEAQAIFQSFRQQLFWLLMARQPARKEITLLISDIDGVGVYKHWLRPLLSELPKRGWSLVAHVHGQARKDESEWPVERIWTPPRSADWLRANILDKPNQFRDILLRISGPEAAVILGLEVGLHRFRGYDPRCDPASMTVSLVAMRTDFTDKEWLESVLSERGAILVSDRGVAARERVRGSDEIRIMGRHRRVSVAPGQYWRRIEAIALEHLLHFIEAGESSGLHTGSLPTSKPTPEQERDDEDR